MFVKILQNSQEKPFARVSLQMLSLKSIFFIEHIRSLLLFTGFYGTAGVAGQIQREFLPTVFMLKKIPSRVLFGIYCKVFQNINCLRTLRNGLQVFACNIELKRTD